MGKVTGFMEFQRKEQKQRPVEERIGDWGEFKLSESEDDLKIQAGRCMNCGVPFCHGGVMLKGRTAGCPLHNLIPEWNDLVWNGRWEEAYQRLIRTNPFPEFTSRVCPAPCEGSCTEGLDFDPVAIRSIEYAIIEKAFLEGWVFPRRSVDSGFKVAIVGSGPAGLSAAYYLNLVGHEVIVYEQSDLPGGLLMYGIPNMKLDKDILARRIGLLKESGVNFILGVEVGKDVLISELMDKYDALLLCCGAGKPRVLNCKGSDSLGVHQALDYLTASTKGLLSGCPSMIDAKGLDVVVVGGGDTGTDCVASAIRQGCKSVIQLEILPCPPLIREEGNPWPEWPVRLNTDYGQQEGIYLTGQDPRHFGVTVSSFDAGVDGRIARVHTTGVTWEGGVPLNISGSEGSFSADLVLLAMGFTGPKDLVPDELGLDRDARGNVRADFGDFMTSEEKVFVAGDMRRGQSLVVWAMEEGKGLAVAVDRYLRGRSILG